MRTIGAGRFATWDALRLSYDPDLVENRKSGLKFNWFCRRFNDEKYTCLFDTLNKNQNVLFR